jgi:hypothetical protein
VLSGIAGLIASIAGLVTAVTGLAGMMIVARRTSPRERDTAATAAKDVLAPSPPITEAEAEALVEIHKARKRRGRRG